MDGEIHKEYHMIPVKTYSKFEKRYTYTYLARFLPHEISNSEVKNAHLRACLRNFAEQREAELRHGTIVYTEFGIFFK